GASVLLRETNALFLAPFIAGSLVRRERGALALSLGAAAGLALRPLASQLAFGDPFFTKVHGYGWSLQAALHNLPLCLFGAAVLVPLGLVAALGYRGPRRPEMMTA